MSLRWERVTSGAGIASAVLLVAGVITYANPHVNDPIRTLEGALVTHHTQVLASIDLQLLSLLPFLVFVAGLWRILRRAEGGDGALSALAFAGGLGLILIIAAWQAVVGAAVLTAKHGGPGELRGMVALGNTFDQISTLPVAVFAGAASLIVLRTRVLPRWTGWLGALIAILSVVGVLDMVDQNSVVGIANPIALLLFLIWIVGVSIAVLRGTGAPEKVKDVATKETIPTR